APGVYAWSIISGGLPTGLSLNPSNGQITGTPTASGTFNFTAKATDSVKGFGTQSLSITVNSAVSITTPQSLPQAEAGAPYTTPTLLASGGTNTKFVWSVASGSSLPTGLTLSPGGAISGTPTAPGPTTFTLQVTDSLGGTASQLFSLTII